MITNNIFMKTLKIQELRSKINSVSNATELFDLVMILTTESRLGFDRVLIPLFFLPKCSSFYHDFNIINVAV